MSNDRQAWIEKMRTRQGWCEMCGEDLVLIAYDYTMSEHPYGFPFDAIWYAGTCKCGEIVELGREIEVESDDALALREAWKHMIEAAQIHRAMRTTEYLSEREPGEVSHG